MKNWLATLLARHRRDRLVRRGTATSLGTKRPGNGISSARTRLDLVEKGRFVRSAVFAPTSPSDF
ncbi:MAG: hypothetical protein CL910_07540 [Deltaproteobacteria bacterium]|jgi:hypothetical protein|nr:hypothetical protein [Deltaproteobacteria bacterium]